MGAFDSRVRVGWQLTGQSHQSARNAAMDIQGPSFLARYTSYSIYIRCGVLPSFRKVISLSCSFVTWKCLTMLSISSHKTIKSEPRSHNYIKPEQPVCHCNGVILCSSCCGRARRLQEAGSALESPHTILPAREPAIGQGRAMQGKAGIGIGKARRGKAGRQAGQGRAGIGIGISLCKRVLLQPPMKLAPAKVAIAFYQSPALLCCPRSS